MLQRTQSTVVSFSMKEALSITRFQLLLGVVTLLNVCLSHALYTCCSEERRGTVCTLAGSGIADSIDSPNASTAAINGPIGIAIQSAAPHSMFVAAHFEHRLRIIHQNGSVSTLAGSIAGFVDSDDPRASRFSCPLGIFTDKEGSVLVSDRNNHRIRTVLRNGSVRTLAGTGNEGYADCADPLQAQFDYPGGITSIVENGQRLIVIGGNWDYHIRVIYANGTVSTLAGSTMECGFMDSADPLAARFCHPIGVVVDRLGNVIVADSTGNRVRKVWRDGSRSGVTTLAGGGSASSVDSDNSSEALFNVPVGVAIDTAGNILVSAHYEQRIRMILVNGSVRTLAGCGPSFADNVPSLQPRFNVPYFLALDEEDNLIVPELENHRISVSCKCARVHVTATSTPTVTYHTVSQSVLYSATMAHSATNSTTQTHSALEAPSHWHSHSLSATLSSSHRATPSHSLRLLPQPPPAPNPISRLVSSEEVARAVVSSGAAAAALAGFAATTSMGHATRMGALMRSVECAFAAGELDPPSYVELPLQWSIESQGGSLGSHAGSALLTSTLLVVLPLLMCAAVHAILSSRGVSELPALRLLQCNVLSRYCLLSMAFFAPNVLMSSVVVVGRGASSGAVVAAICAAVFPLMLGCVAAQRALAMDVEIVPLCGGKWDLRNRPSSRAYVETFGGLVSGCRDPMPYIVRVCSLEDAAASLVLSLLSGVSLSTVRCEWVAVAMLVVSALHLLYVVCVRPLYSKIESAMNCGLCGVQLLMAALCLAIASGADNPAGVLMSVLGVLAVVQNASFFGQAAILATCACVSENRKKQSAMNCGLCGVQLLMAALCLAIASGADSSGGVLMSVLGAVAVVQNASFFGQAAILAACACVSESRKKHAALPGDGPSGGTSMVVVSMSHEALLSPPEAKQLPLIAAST